MIEKFTLIAFKGAITDAGRKTPEEAPFEQQKACLNDIELYAYNAVISEIRIYGYKKSGASAESGSGILFRGFGHFPANVSDPSRMVCGRYAVISVGDELSGILVLFIGSNLKGPGTIEMIGLRRFKPFKDGSPNSETITHVIPPEPKQHNDGF